MSVLYSFVFNHKCKRHNGFAKVVFSFLHLKCNRGDLSLSPQRLLVDMKHCSQSHITQREKEAQELQQAILCLTVSGKTTQMGGRNFILQHTHRTSL